jgi:membrane-associated protease RseP (regulator of RpoE activity)
MKKLWSYAALAALCLAPPAWADEPAKPEKIEVPYRLTVAKHILVRAKINGKGPFNFILDTGAPALFVSTEVCKQLGVKPDDNGWGSFDRFEIEGGVVLTKAKGRVEDPFQLKGMNSLGLAGCKLHGVIGYNILAHYRMEIDVTTDKMVWTPLAWKPVAPTGLGGKAAGGVDAMSMMVDLAVALIGKQEIPEPQTRGFYGLELAENKGGAQVTAVVADGPAAKAGLKVGDLLTSFDGTDVESIADIHKAAAKLLKDKEVKLTVKRGEAKIDLTLKTGEGL